jgi:uncharacterized protein (TIGR03435 family)
MRLHCASAVVLTAFLVAPFARAQATFDVASVKENKASTDGRTHIYSSSSNLNFRGVNVPIKMLLQSAYGLPETQILGVSGAVTTAMFDIDAKSEPPDEAQFAKLTNDERMERKQTMLQALFKERFKLAAHTETRELPIYALVVTKGGNKLKPTETKGLTINGGYGKFSAQGLTTEALAHELAKLVGRPVVDETAAAGRFDVALQWTPEQGPAKINGAPIPDPPPDLYTAIVDQLGLKLEPRKGPVPVLVVDHLEMADQN